MLTKNRDAILSTDCKLVTVDQLETFFHAANCRSLCGVPKIFLIDACRGNRKEKVYKSEPTGGMVTKNSSANLRSLTRAPYATDSGDFLIVYASTNGKVTYTDDNKGSQMTQMFVKLTNEADNDTPFTKIIQAVKANLQQADSPQTVESIDRLPRDYYIKRYIYHTSLLIELLYRISDFTFLEIHQQKIFKHCTTKFAA